VFIERVAESEMMMINKRLLRRYEKSWTVFVIAHDFMDSFHCYSFLKNGLLVTYLQLHFIRYHTSKTFETTILISGDCRLC